MAVSRQVWKGWFASFSALQATWPDGVPVSCPAGAVGRVRLAYVGDLDRRVGVAFAGCDPGKQGTPFYIGRCAGRRPDAELRIAGRSRVGCANGVKFLSPDPFMVGETFEW
jgi:hypothetical protein